MAKDATSSVIREVRTSRPGRSAWSIGDASGANRGLARDGEGSGRVPTRPDADIERGITLRLTRAQVDQVARAVGGGGPMSVLLSGLWDPGWRPSPESWWQGPAPRFDDPRLSRCLLLGLLVLACFRPNGAFRGVADIARMLDMSHSTAHRYVSTLAAVGLLEHEPDSRKYRIRGTG
jgi:hypothetical protein